MSDRDRQMSNIHTIRKARIAAGFLPDLNLPAWAEPDHPLWPGFDSWYRRVHDSWPIDERHYRGAWSAWCAKPEGDGR